MATRTGATRRNIVKDADIANTAYNINLDNSEAELSEDENHCDFDPTYIPVENNKNNDSENTDDSGAENGDAENDYSFFNQATDGNTSDTERYFIAEQIPPSQGAAGNTTPGQVPVTDQSSVSKKKRYANWRRKEFSPKEPCISQPSLPPINTNGFSDLNYFQQYIGDEILEVMCQMTSQTYLERCGRPMNLNVKELKTFWGISLIMGCLQYPKIRMYWDRRWFVPIVSENMTRDRFFTIRKSLKLVFDDDVPYALKLNDRLWKIRPLLDSIRSGCLKLERESNVCVDEMMVPFSGVCSLKQYMPNKPNPEGLKVFVLADPAGLVLDFHFYQGETTFPEYTERGYGLCESAVLKLTESLTPGHSIYHDRFFTSYKLVTSLKKVGLYSTGTIAKNRIPKNARIKEDKVLRKEGRGSCDMIVNAQETVAITKWFDKKGILMMSSAHGVSPKDKCKRYIKKEKKYIDIDRPKVISEYNRHMGGVDLFDRMLSYCPMQARTKKWTIRVIMHMFDFAVANAWTQQRKDLLKTGTPRKRLPQLRNFKLSLGEALIYSDGGNKTIDNENSDENVDDDLQDQSLPSRKRKIPVPLPRDEKRKQNIGHMPIIENIKDWQKCRRPGCGKKTRTKCSTCNIFLCLGSERNCYTDYHQS